MKALNQPGVCFICRRRDCGLGVDQGRYEQQQVGWMCQACTDAGFGRLALEAPDQAFDAVEHRALLHAAAQAGGYLDTLGRYDVGELHPDEWLHVMRTAVEGFASAIRRELMSAAEKGHL